MLNKKDPKGSKKDHFHFSNEINGQKIGFCPSVMANQIHYFFSMPLIEKKSNASENF